jgi:site-specific recombinase XerD
LSYVYYSQQYKCYYLRERDTERLETEEVVKEIAVINKKYLYKVPKWDAKVDALAAFDTSSHRIKKGYRLPLSINVINQKGYLKLPLPHKREWLDYLKSIGGIFESRRRIWIIPNYLTFKDSITDYFEKENCNIKITIKSGEKATTPSSNQAYRGDKEIQSYIKVMTLQGASKRTIDNYACQIKKLKAHYDGKAMVDIDNEEIIDYLFFLREELSYSTSAQNIVVSAVKRFLLAFTEREINTINIPRPKAKKSLPKVLEKSEVESLLRQDIYIKHKCILYMLYATGIRCGELINLKVEDINFNTKTIIINKGKGDKSRVVTLPNKLSHLLLSYLGLERPLVYCFEGSKGGKYSPTSVQKIVKRSVLKAGIDKRVTPHMLRHSYATHLHDSGMDIRHIQRLLGHSSTKTTEIYTYVSKKDICQLKSPLDNLDI